MRPGLAGFLPVVTLLVGCAYTYQVQSAGGDPSPFKVASDDSIFVGLPEDARYASIVYAGSGRMTNQALVTALSHQSRFVRSASSVADLEGNITAARKHGVSYLIHPEIVHWEERATHWSGKSDRVSVRLLVVEVSTGTMVDSSLISAQSRFIQFGDEHAQDLLPKPLEEYAAQIIDPERVTSVQLGDRIQDLANQLSAQIDDHSISRVAILPARDASHELNKPFGNYLTDKLTTALYRTGSARLIERVELDKVTDEIALTMTGRFDDASLYRIGNLLGVDAVILSTYTEVGAMSLDVNAKIVSVETGEILGVGAVQIPRTAVTRLLG